MTMLAQHVSINRVENGWVLTVMHGGNGVTLVAKEIAEIVGFVKGLEWHTPRPLPNEMGMTAEAAR